MNISTRYEIDQTLFFNNSFSIQFAKVTSIKVYVADSRTTISYKFGDLSFYEDELFTSKEELINSLLKINPEEYLAPPF